MPGFLEPWLPLMLVGLDIEPLPEFGFFDELSNVLEFTPPLGFFEPLIGEFE